MKGLKILIATAIAVAISATVITAAQNMREKNKEEE